MRDLKPLLALLVGCVAALAPALSTAQPYPSKPLRMIVPQGAGGSTDSLARSLAKAMGEALGQPVIVDNRAGAGGILGVGEAQKAPADGYTLLFGSNTTMAANTFLYKSVPYDPLKDFVPISAIATVQFALLTSSDVPATTISQLVTLAKAKPGSLNYGAGTGSGLLCAEIFKSAARVDITKVPYRSTAQALNDLLGGQIQLVCEPLTTSVQHVKTGRLRALGVMSSKRSTFLPEWPTVAEGGVRGAEYDAWTALYLPAGAPKEVQARLVSVVGDILRNKEFQDRIKSAAWELMPIGPEWLDQRMRAEMGQLAKTVKEANIAPE
ncbi:MAG TPA: tripartite tricarboxylate transporter substrate binding protein [Albitalea sp.]|nr:tripartite tricarboxylate transporter substrate binding protein [Albitalea sp.]